MSCSCHHCRHKRTDSRDGAGRKNRLLKALDPKEAPLDDRKIEDLLAQVKSYAAKVRFFPTPEEDDDTIISWQTLLERDMSVMLASVVLSDPSEQEQLYNRFRRDLYADPTEEHLEKLFEPINTLRIQIERWHEQLSSDNPLRADLVLLTRSGLSPQLEKAISIAMALERPSSMLNLAIVKNSIWDFDSNELEPDPLLSLQTPDEGGIAAEEVHPLVEVSFSIDDIFQAFYQTTVEIISRSHEHLDFSLQQYPEHQPHLALLIAFLELFKHLQRDLNDVTRRHLDFFYRDVLHLSERPAIPDQVHVIFELAKGVNDYVVDFGTPLPGGAEQGSGKEIIYRTGENNTEERAPFVPNRAIVREIKNVYLELDLETKTHPVDFHANPIANSADGNGAAFPVPGSSFDTFGVGGRDEETKLTMCNFMQKTGQFLNKARIGFAIATPQLLLGGGVRNVQLKIKGLKEILQNAQIDKIGRIMEIWLSSEKGWMPLKYLQPSSTPTNISYFNILPDTTESDGLDADRTLQIVLPVSAPKIIPFDPTIHPGDLFPTTSPVMKVILRNLDKDHFSTSPVYEQLVIDAGFSLKTAVGDISAPDPANGLKDLFVQNLQQPVENGKTFFAFGQLPGNGVPLYVGSPEFFSKPIKVGGDFKLHVKWAASTAIPELSLDLLKNKNWQGADAANLPTTTTNTSAISGTAILNRSYNLVKEPFDADVENGFFRITPSGITGNIAARALLGIALQAEYISIEYDSTLLYKDLQPGIDQFFHLYPFGFVPVYPAKNFGEVLDMQTLSGGLFVNAQVPGTELNPQWYMFPQFQFGAPDDRVLLPNESQQYNQATLQTGHLIIGLEHLAPPQNLSLLFKFEEGTQADDDGTPPTVHWSYLIDNKWRPLPGDAILNDGTFGLQTTGIILFDLPKDINTGNTLLPANQRWLCASVSDNPDRMPRLINIHAQAVTATFDNQGHDAKHYLTAFPAGSISALKVPVDAVKSVAQPYESFGGRAADSGNDFYMEASERIRHKGRAVTVWDYEHMILSHFPSVFKVKAIPVSDPDCNCRKPEKNPCRPDGEAHECSSCGEQTAPGHVMVVPIPDFRLRVGGNRLQPKNSNRVLQEIEKYLGRRVSPFVKVRAKNPKYEEVLVSFSVQFREGIDKGVFLRRLNDDLVRFLTPWAFEESADMRFDGHVYASDVINFIEERPYVDFIVDFRMFHCKDDCCGVEEELLKEVRGIIREPDVAAVEGPVIPTALIQIVGTVLQVASDENGKFRILLADGDRILVKADGYGTRIFRYDKKNDQLIDELDEKKILDDGTTADKKIELRPLLPTPLTILITSFKTYIKDGFNNTPSGQTTILPDSISFWSIDGFEITGTEVPINTPFIIRATGFTDKEVIVGKALESDSVIYLFPQKVPLTLKVAISGSTSGEVIDDATVIDVQNNEKKAEKTNIPGQYQFTELEVGHIIVVSAEGFIPRAIAITEALIRGLGAAGADPLSVSLLPDCQHRLENTDELIEFWEKVMSTYYPDARGIQLGIRPCSPQSILVSAAQHLIQLYEPRPAPDPCAPASAPVTRPARAVGGGSPQTQPGVTGTYSSQPSLLQTRYPAILQFKHLNQNIQFILPLFESWGLANYASALGLQHTIFPNLFVVNQSPVTGINATNISVEPVISFDPDIFNAFRSRNFTFNNNIL